MEVYPFPTGIRMCRCRQCMYHEANSPTAYGIYGCMLKCVEVGSDGKCKSMITLPKPTVNEVKEYFKEKGVMIKE